MNVSAVGQKNNLGWFCFNYLVNQVLNLYLDVLQVHVGKTDYRAQIMAQLEISLLSNII